ncbi:DedA family protein [Laceyella tengchongensis]
MLQIALDFLDKCGMWGLFVATAIEASSLPFPGALFVLIYGYLMDVSPWTLVLISAINSFVYVAFSLIPFYLGTRIEKFSKKKFDQKKIEKAQMWFKKYGEWSITLSRPTGFGNYISYISGMSHISLWRFIVFSYLGVFPWNTVLLFVGRKGNLDTVQHFLDLMQKFGYILAGVVALAFGVWYLFKKNKQRTQCEKG